MGTVKGRGKRPPRDPDEMEARRRPRVFEAVEAFNSRRWKDGMPETIVARTYPATYRRQTEAHAAEARDGRIHCGWCGRILRAEYKVKWSDPKSGYKYCPRCGARVTGVDPYAGEGADDGR